MGWILHHTKRDGSRSATRHENGRAVVLARGDPDIPHIHVKPGSEEHQRFMAAAREVRRRAITAFHGMTESEKRRAREEIKATRQENRSRHGMTAHGNMRKVASIPPKLYAQERARSGVAAMQDPKHMRRFISEHGLRVDR